MFKADRNYLPAYSMLRIFFQTSVLIHLIILPEMHLIIVYQNVVYNYTNRLLFLLDVHQIDYIRIFKENKSQYSVMTILSTLLVTQHHLLLFFFLPMVINTFILLAQNPDTIGHSIMIYIDVIYLTTQCAHVVNLKIRITIFSHVLSMQILKIFCLTKYFKL